MRSKRDQRCKSPVSGNLRFDHLTERPLLADSAQNATTPTRSEAEARNVSHWGLPKEAPRPARSPAPGLPRAEHVLPTTTACECRRRDTRARSQPAWRPQDRAHPQRVGKEGALYCPESERPLPRKLHTRYEWPELADCGSSGKWRFRPVSDIGWAANRGTPKNPVFDGRVRGLI
jgi:hypothetical protein